MAVDKVVGAVDPMTANVIDEVKSGEVADDVIDKVASVEVADLVTVDVVDQVEEENKEEEKEDGSVEVMWWVSLWNSILRLMMMKKNWRWFWSI